MNRQFELSLHEEKKLKTGLHKNNLTASIDVKQCYFCNRKAHFKQDYFKYKSFKKERANKVTETNIDDIYFMESYDVKMILLRDVDSGASSQTVSYKEFYTQFDGSVVRIVRAFMEKMRHSQC